MAAYTEQELAIFAAAVSSLPANANALLAAKSPQETADAITTLVLRSRSDAAVTSASAVVSLTVNNWAAIDALEAALPAGTLIEDLTAAKAACEAHNAAALGPRLLTIFLAACRHFGI